MQLYNSVHRCARRGRRNDIPTVLLRVPVSVHRTDGATGGPRQMLMELMADTTLKKKCASTRKKKNRGGHCDLLVGITCELEILVSI